jgi:hypothetical protein
MGLCRALHLVLISKTPRSAPCCTPHGSPTVRHGFLRASEGPPGQAQDLYESHHAKIYNMVSNQQLLHEARGNTKAPGLFSEGF